MERGNTNWGQSVTGVVIHEGKVLLARHTYGGGNGKLIIPSISILRERRDRQCHCHSGAAGLSMVKKQEKRDGPGGFWES